jgi:hypothetical protein
MFGANADANPTAASIIIMTTASGTTGRAMTDVLFGYCCFFVDGIGRRWTGLRKKAKSIKTAPHDKRKRTSLRHSHESNETA